MPRRRHNDDDEIDDDGESSELRPNTPKVSRAEARSLLVGPATVLEVMAWISVVVFILFGIYAIALDILQISVMRQVEQNFIIAMVVKILYFAIGAGVQGILATYAGKMRNRFDYTAAVTCVFLAIVPCCSPIPFYLNYLGIAICLMVILQKDELKRAANR